MKLSCFFLDEKQVNEKRFSTAGDGLKFSRARFLYHIEEEWKRERVEAEPAIDEFSYWAFFFFFFFPPPEQWNSYLRALSLLQRLGKRFFGTIETEGEIAFSLPRQDSN